MYVPKKKKHFSSCEIEDFVETQLCKLAVCAWYPDRAYYGLCVLVTDRRQRDSPCIKDIGRRLPLELQCSYQGQQSDVSQSVRGRKPVFEGDKTWQLWKEMHQFIKCTCCKCCTTSEERVECSKGWGGSSGEGEGRGVGGGFPTALGRMDV